MRKHIFLIALFSAFKICFCQTAPAEYHQFIEKANAFFKAGDFKSAAISYSDAFKSFGWLGYISDRYKAGESWAMAGNADSAFFNLERIVSKGYYIDLHQLTNDSLLISLHADTRWPVLVGNVRALKEKSEEVLSKPLVQELAIIHDDDQKYRLMIDSVESAYGSDSKEMQNLWKVINEKDLANLQKVIVILEKYGWLGADSIGQQGNNTLFLVIQHADLATQEKYMPMMKEAVKNGKASPSALALLIDRVEMRNGRPQIYGSQVTTENNKKVFYKIIDEPNVNKRRESVGLEPLEEYAKYFGIDYALPEK